MRKTMKRLKQGVLMLLMLLVLSCSATAVLPAPITAEAAAIKISKTKITLNKGKTYQLKIKGTKQKVTWKSNKPSVAKVSSKGLVTAKKTGTARITAKVSGKKYTCIVTVENPHFEYETMKLPLNYGIDLHLKGTTQKIKWSSSNKKVVTVTSNGVIFGKSVGTATITAKVNGDKFQCTVEVIASDNNNQDPGNTNPPQTEPEPPQNEPEQTEPEPPQTEPEQTQPELPEGLEGRLLMMSAYGLNAAYNAAKFPSTLHLNRIVYDPNYTNVYGDKVVRMVVCCYSMNSLGGYGDIYVLMLGADSNKNYEDSMSYDNLSKTYFTTRISSLDPGTSGERFDNKKAVDAYNQYLGDTYGRKDIPYD